MSDLQKPTPPTTLWDFVRLAAPHLGIVLTPHIQMLCEAFDAALGTTIDVATFHGVDAAERGIREHAQDTLSDAELSEYHSSPMRIDERHARAWLGLRRAALAYAAAKLREAGEAGTERAALLLLEQIAEGLT